MSKVVKMVNLGLGAALTGGVLFVLSGPGTRLGYWDLKAGKTLLAASGTISFLAGFLCLWGLILIQMKGRRTNLGLLAGVVGLLLSLVIFDLSYLIMFGQKNYGLIDATTDIQHPPVFTAPKALRQPGWNSLDYRQPDPNQMQKIAGLGLQPLFLDRSVEYAWARAQEGAKKLGWQDICLDKTKGVLEATVVSFWFGVKDDVCVRIKHDKTGTLIDVRSVAREGTEDKGRNVRNIHRFLNWMVKDYMQHPGP